MYQRIKAVRTALGLTQTEFGKQLGVSRDVIGNIECNRARLRTPFVEHLCERFLVNQAWLETGIGDMFVSPESQLPQKQLREAISIFSNLNTDYQNYALRQIRELLELQKERKE